MGIGLEVIPTNHKGEPIKFDINNKRVWRIFNNGTWDNGGRYWGGCWQSKIPSDTRPLLTIKREPVVELDFEAFHPRLLYALEGLDYVKQIGNTDPYEIDGLTNKSDKKKERNLLKALVFVGLNATSKGNAMKGIRKVIHEDKQRVAYRRKFPELPATWKELQIILDALETGIMDTHRLIKAYLYSGIGIKLQYLESQIASHVIDTMTAKGVPVLCIHDSFICQVKYQDGLQALMQEGFELVMCQPAPVIKASDFNTVIPVLERYTAPVMLNTQHPV